MEVKHHIDLLNEMGFDVSVLALQEEPHSLSQIPLTSNLEWGLVSVWADQVELALNQLPGAKIVFTMSNTSAAAIIAIARRNAEDIKSLVCDSGPVASLWPAVLNLYTYAYPVAFLPERLLKSAIGTVVWASDYSRRLHGSLDRFPEGFRVLSIRGWKDRLNSVENIDRVFEPHHQLNWQKLAFVDSDHVRGLKDHPQEYREALEKFLRSSS